MFKKYPKKLVLKDDTRVIIRPLERADKDVLHKFFSNLPDNDKLYLRNDVTDPKFIEKWLEQLDLGIVTTFIAEYEDKIVGECSLHQSPFGWFRHVGEIRLVISKDFRRKGLGLHLAKEIFDMAISLKIEKVISFIMSDQESAAKIFNKIGFDKEAELTGHIKDLNDQRHNLLIMAQDVQELWKRIEDLIHDSYDDLSGSYFAQ